MILFGGVLKDNCLFSISRTKIRWYLFILCSEAWAIQLIDGHHDGHHVFTIHDGDGEDVLGLILRQLIHKPTEMRALMRRGKKEKSPLWLIACYSSQQQLPDTTLTPQPHTHSKQRLSIISKLETPSVLHSSYCSSCAAEAINCVVPGVKLRKRGSLTAKKEHKCTENNPGARGARFMWGCMFVRPCPANYKDSNSIQIQSLTLLWILEHNRVQ